MEIISSPSPFHSLSFSQGYYPWGSLLSENFSERFFPGSRTTASFGRTNICPTKNALSTSNMRNACNPVKSDREMHLKTRTHVKILIKVRERCHAPRDSRIFRNIPETLFIHYPSPSDSRDTRNSGNIVRAITEKFPSKKGNALNPLAGHKLKSRVKIGRIFPINRASDLSQVLLYRREGRPIDQIITL